MENFNTDKKNSILIVDDDLGYAEIMKRYLRDLYDVNIVSSGKKALNYLFFNDVDLVILDIEMPEVDGFTTYDSIRSLENCENIPIIFSTGVKNKATVLRTVSKKADGCMLKPTSRSDMLSIINKVLDKYNYEKSKKKILIIDDDVEFLKITKSYLNEKYHVDIVNTYNLAMEYFASHIPDLILLDYEMPMYNGLSLLGLIRNKRGFENVPVMMVSGNTERDVISNLFKYKIKDYLKKPINKEVLLNKVEKVLKDSE